MFDYLIWLEEVDSTQKVLKEGSFPQGTVVVSKRQKGGKGRKGRRWESQEGGLYFSFVLSENFFKDLRGYPLVVALSLLDALGNLGFPCAIKWPNDVYLSGKKVAGILVEKTADKVITGVGVNVNQREFKGELSHRATSLANYTGRELVVREVLSAILQDLAETLTSFAERGFSAYRDRIRSSLLYLGEEVVITDEKELVTGIFRDVGEDGSLILETSEGRRMVLAGDLTLRAV